MAPRPQSDLSVQLRVQPSDNGVARYPGDTYYRSAQDQDFTHIPGPPWVITTLWTADHRILTSDVVGDVVHGLKDIVWVADRALPSSVLPEQVDPRSGEHRSTSPLTWSHAAVVDTITHLLDAMGKLGRTSLDGIGDEPPDWAKRPDGQRKADRPEARTNSAAKKDEKHGSGTSVNTCSSPVRECP